MKEIDLKSWDEYPKKILEIKKEYASYEVAGIQHRNLILFRGQADSECHLKTTLERYSEETWTLSSYYRLVHRCAFEIESFTGKKWDVPEFTDNSMFNFDGISIKVPSYAFWTYLRHHSFPSPLLDWSHSPYLAAFFAFEDHQTKATKASIYAFIKTLEGTEHGSIGGPRINIFGPYIHTHKRHFMQQSWYTICVQKKNEDYELIGHENVCASSDKNQDVLIKINIPRTERINALRYLYDFNINSFSLMQTEDSLSKTLAFKELELKGNL